MPLPHLNRRASIIARVVGAAAIFVMPSVATGQPAPQCTPVAATSRVPELVEGSGVAASRTTPGRFWAHNDSGEPVLFALDARGTVTGRLQLSGARVKDWEAIAVGSCASGSCIYVADIGDNSAKRKQITVYRIVEPRDLAAPVQAEALHATYPDGPRNAESLLVSADGRLHIVTKGDTAPASVYRFPTELQSGPTMRLERVGSARTQHTATANDRITDGAISPDSQWVALRGTKALTFYRSAELLAGTWREAGRVPLDSLDEPQGEGVTFGSDNSVYVVGEGGGKRQPGTFARLSCTPVS